MGLDRAFVGVSKTIRRPTIRRQPVRRPAIHRRDNSSTQLVDVYLALVFGPSLADLTVGELFVDELSRQ